MRNRSSCDSGQRKGTRLSGRILGRDDEKRFRQRPGFALGGDLALFHGFQQRALALGRRPIDLVGQHHLSKQRPSMKRNSPVFRSNMEVPMMSAGRHVAGELDAVVASARAPWPARETSSVLPMPGRSSISRWPRANRQASAKLNLLFLAEQNVVQRSRAALSCLSRQAWLCSSMTV